MNRCPSKGKGKRCASPSSSSDEDNGIQDQKVASKRRRHTSTERISASAVAKLGKNSMSGSSSKGMAGFSALVSNSTNLYAAQAETNCGLKSGPSGRSQGRTSAKPKAVAKTDMDSITVGTIVFLVVGIAPTALEDPSDTSSFHPVYCLRTDVDVSPMALTGMKQAGLCVMRDVGFEFQPTDTYGMVDHLLQSLFPRLFEWLSEDDADGGTSSWLVCMRPAYKKSPVVYTDDSDIPNGYDIIQTSIMTQPKANMHNRVAYFVTRNPVPPDIVLSWRPKALSQRPEAQETDSDDEVDTSSDPPPLPSLISQAAQHRCTRSRVKYENEESEVETEVISISDDDDSAPNATGKEGPATDPATPPPYIADVNASFSSSMYFGDDNPWN